MGVERASSLNFFLFNKSKKIDSYKNQMMNESFPTMPLFMVLFIYLFIYCLF